MSQMCCIELFAGCAKLSAALRAAGFQVVPIDSRFNKHKPFVKCIELDLTLDSSFDILESILREHGAICYLHLAPPCGTASRARNRPVPAWKIAQGAPNPVPLRSSSQPRGLPGLEGKDARRVLSANLLYEFTAKVFVLCMQLGIMCSIENPLNSYFWDMPCIQKISHLEGVHEVCFQHCMYQGLRDKWSKWLVTANLQTLQG